VYKKSARKVRNKSSNVKHLPNDWNISLKKNWLEIKQRNANGMVANDNIDVYKKAKHVLDVCFRVHVWAIRVVSHKIYIFFPNHLQTFFPGAVFVRKAIIYYLKKPRISFVTRNWCIKCGEIIRFDAVKRWKECEFKLPKIVLSFEYSHMIEITTRIGSGTISL
jgi:hypothetical protein